MPRKARVILADTPHHIMQRGHNRNAVFVEQNDYCYYLSTLKKWKHELNIKVYAWCLMTNHVHLILDPGENVHSIGLLMKRLAARQTRYVNKHEGRSGSLWDGRYKASPIETDAYLLQCCRYIELNPVRAGMVSQPDEYEWSSYRAKIGRTTSSLLDFDPCYLGLKSPEKSYREFVLADIHSEELKLIRERGQRNQLTGSESFVDEVEQRIGLRIESRRAGRPKVPEK